ncbi:hypothetical protein B0T26DRAFT_674218 [Lasiosphaeria miniovina]|uniref:Uncharacterized protein n=1 Tax=Lasiosphaeria miniovina TaxID=1954250 RepID=A0AA40AV31_9PEZI|nr:uncharacterized protein B0T26DRAFT_674218 [Lasiosphaeria miniovina]KAK0722532.1 hypothetical protein B0T26DRAFT_674218 [Lasiosphaeria miniovina]
MEKLSPSWLGSLQIWKGNIPDERPRSNDNATADVAGRKPATGPRPMEELIDEAVADAQAARRRSQREWAVSRMVCHWRAELLWASDAEFERLPLAPDRLVTRHLYRSGKKQHAADGRLREYIVKSLRGESWDALCRAPTADAEGTTTTTPVTGMATTGATTDSCGSYEDMASSLPAVPTLAPAAAPAPSPVLPRLERTDRLLRRIEAYGAVWVERDERCRHRVGAEEKGPRPRRRQQKEEMDYIVVGLDGLAAAVADADEVGGDEDDWDACADATAAMDCRA